MSRGRLLGRSCRSASDKLLVLSLCDRDSLDDRARDDSLHEELLATLGAAGSIGLVVIAYDGAKAVVSVACSADEEVLTARCSERSSSEEAQEGESE